MQRKINRTAKGWVAFEKRLWNKLDLRTGNEVRQNKFMHRSFILAVSKEAKKCGYGSERKIPDKVMDRIENYYHHYLLVDTFIVLRLTTPSWRAKYTAAYYKHIKKFEKLGGRH